MAVSDVKPDFDLQAWYLARSAPFAEAGNVEGASPDTACLCRAYNSKRSLFDIVLAALKFFMNTTLARNVAVTSPLDDILERQYKKKTFGL